MKQHSMMRLVILLSAFGTGLMACSSQPVKTEPPVTAQTAMQSAKEAYQRKDCAQAADWFRRAAELGDAKAQYNLGMAYDKGQGVAQNYPQAAQWYRKSADQGLAQAQNNLGFLYKQGQGVPQDYGQAAAWFRKSADQGYAQAQYNLGLAYRDGQGVKQDQYQAIQFLRKAAQQGDADAQTELSQLKTRANSAKKKH